MCPRGSRDFLVPRPYAAKGGIHARRWAPAFAGVDRQLDGRHRSSPPPAERRAGDHPGRAAARREYRHRGAGDDELRARRSAPGAAARRLAHRRAVAAASGADAVLDKARLYPAIAAAIADLVHVYASTARDRYMVKRVVTPRQAAARNARIIAAGRAVRRPVRAGAHRARQRRHHARRHGADGAAQPRLSRRSTSPRRCWSSATNGSPPRDETPPETLHTGHSAARRPRPSSSTFFDASRGGARQKRLYAPPRKPPEHGAQPAQPVSARPLHRAGIAHPARRRHRLCRPARTRQSVGVRRVGSRREGLNSARSRSNFVAARLGETEYRAQISESGESAR